MKKLLCLMICILLVISMTVPAFAEEVEPSGSPAPISEEENQGSQDTPPESSGESGGTVTPPACTSHTWNEGTVTTAATCVNEGVKTLTCTVCSATSTASVPATGVHTPGSWQSVDGTNHKRNCTGCGGAEETAAHGWDSGTVTTQPTCTAEGVKTYSCACGATKTEAIAIVSTAHTYGDWVLSEESHSRTCTSCNNPESGAHSWGVSATVPATCKEEGATAYGCTICGGIAYEIIPKLTTHTYDTACDPDCNVCGITREIEHKYSTAWSKNSTQHWHACTLCGDKADVGSHYPGPAATEEKAQLCLTCGLTMTPKLNHTHKYATNWSSDETGHWYACDGCEEQKGLKEHSYDDPCDPDCNECGYKTSTAHSYSEVWNSDETGHWSVCTLCGEDSEIEEHIPGPEATETEAQKCTICDFEMASPQEHVHEYGETWLMDEENHWQECECGEKTEPAPHTWDEGTEKDDTITYVCTECQAERTEEVPEGDFPWWIVIMALLLLVCAGAAVALVLVLRKPKASGKFTK